MEGYGVLLNGSAQQGIDEPYDERVGALWAPDLHKDGVRCRRGMEGGTLLRAHTSVPAGFPCCHLPSFGSACTPSGAAQSWSLQRSAHRQACMHAGRGRACLVRAAGLRGLEGGEREEDGLLRGELRSLSLPESSLFLLLLPLKDRTRVSD